MMRMLLVAGAKALARGRALGDACHSNGTRSLLTRRSIATSAVQNKWVPGKESVGPNIAVGTSAGPQDDPIMNVNDRHWVGDAGDPAIKEWYYREPPPQFATRFERMMLTTTSSFLVGWIVYHIYYNYAELIGGEFYAPRPEEFTDEELGIPPDDAPDPEYWGDHHLSRNMKL